MLSVRRSRAPLGAEIAGIDLSGEVDARTFRDIVELFHQHEVVCFPDQKLTPEQHVAFSTRFGEIWMHHRTDCCRPGYPEIFVVSNIVENGRPIGSRDAGVFWHSDFCYVKEPARASLLYAREVPQKDGGPLGDTLFASMTTAYEALPDATKRRLEGLKAVNSYSRGYYRDRKSGPRRELTEEQKSITPDVEHPVARTHPYTGKKCLFVNEGYTTRIVGMSETESEALLAELFAHVARPEFVYRHRWRVGDLVMWDNCSTQHRAVMDYALPQRRHMERTTLHGTAPF
ncbi:MAG: TauD/TfdA family dioxygenase [Betaproteobacteria bacterium]|nr:TauD/TfdA family dioxygenase [Betaproteobacteria bacterium]